MEKEKVIDCFRRLNLIFDKLPKGAEVIDISLSGDGYALLYGDFDFRQFAEAEGAAVDATLCKTNAQMDYIGLSARLFGFEVIYSIYPNEPGYDEELRRCEDR